jgi:hypothetical protein
MKLCNAAGCSREVLYGDLCAIHAERKHRFGHPDFAPLVRREVRQYRDIVEHEMVRTKVQADIEEYYDTMLEEQKAVVAEMNQKGVGHLDRYFAALDFVDAVGDHKRQVLLDLMALGWMLQVQPDRVPHQASIVLVATKVLRWSLVKGTKRSLRKDGQIQVSRRAIKRSAKIYLGEQLVPTLVSFGYAMAKTFMEHEKNKGDLKRDIMCKITGSKG